MMFRILVALCLATSALAQICCTPSQWEGTEVVLKSNGQGSNNDNTDDVKKSLVLVSYDAENNRTSRTTNVTSMNGEEQRFHFISDYIEMKKYAINLDDESCYSHDLHGSFEQNCVDDSATLLNSGLLGIGDDTLSTSTYLKNDHSGRLETTVTEECVPVSQVKMSKFGQNSVDYTLYVNITAGIVDINIFTPPAYCNETSLLKSVLYGGT